MQISWMTKFTLLLCSAMTIMSGTAIVASLPMIKIHFIEHQYADLLSRLILTAPAISIVFFAPFVNRITSHYGKKRVLSIAMFLFAVFGVSGAFFDSLEMIIFSRLLFGAATAFIMSISMALVGDYMAQEERMKYLGIQNAFVAFGGAIFMAGGGMLSLISWHGAFYIYAIAFVIFAFTLFFIIEPPKESLHVEDIDEPHIKRLSHIFLTAFLIMSIFYMVPTQLPYLLSETYQMGANQVGFLMATVTVINALASLSYGRLRKRLSVAKIYKIVFLIQGSGFIALSYSTSYLQFSLSLILVGLGLGLVIVNTTSWLLESATAKERLKATGLMTSSIFLGQFFSPVLMHLPVAYFGVAGVFAVVGVLLYGWSAFIYLRGRQ